jgi:hypothetical protein
MTCLREPLGRLVDRENGCAARSGKNASALWLSSTNRACWPRPHTSTSTPEPHALAATPKESETTSLRVRLDHCRAQGRIETLRDALSTQTVDEAQEAGPWLRPVNHLRAEGGARAGLALSCDLRLLDGTSGKRLSGRRHCRVCSRKRSRRVSHLGWRESLIAAARSRGRRWHGSRLPRFPTGRTGRRVSPTPRSPTLSAWPI